MPGGGARAGAAFSCSHSAQRRSLWLKAGTSRVQLGDHRQQPACRRSWHCREVRLSSGRAGEAPRTAFAWRHTMDTLANGRLLMRRERGNSGHRHRPVTWGCACPQAATSALHVWVSTSVCISGQICVRMSGCLLSGSLCTYTNMAVCRVGVGRKELYQARQKR